MTVINTQVERINIEPQRLLVDLNVRLNANLNKEFIGSIKDHGVLQPIVAVRTASGDLRVRYGHRRTLAAVEAGLNTVPVEVIGDEGTDDAAQIERIITQHAENAHRSALTSLEEVHVVEQLAAFGMSAGQIQKRTHMKRPTVEHAIAVSGSDLAKAATERYDFLSLEQAAAVAEFDGKPESVKALIAAAKSGQFEHVAQRLRDERAEEEERSVLVEFLKDAGVPLIDRPLWQDKTRRIYELREDGEPLSIDAHSQCPGHAAFIEEQWVSEEDDLSALVAVYVCTDPKAFGHIPPGSVDKTSTPVSPEDVEAAKQQRREVLANNKAWRSAETVRRNWLRSFLKRKTAPKGATVFVAGEVASGSYELRKAMERRHALGCELLDTPAGEIADVLDRATDSRQNVVLLGLVVASVEAETGVHTWRNPSATSRRYFQALSGWGYVLSDVERIAMGEEAAK